MKQKMLPWTLHFANIWKMTFSMDVQHLLAGPFWLGLFKLCQSSSSVIPHAHQWRGSATKTPVPSIRTVMLQELTQPVSNDACSNTSLLLCLISHHRGHQPQTWCLKSQTLHRWCRLIPLILMSLPTYLYILTIHSLFLVLIPMIACSQYQISKWNTTWTGSDAIVNYWKKFQPLVFSTLRCLYRNLPSSIFWRIHNPERFHCKLRVEPQTFDGLVHCIKDHPVFHNNSNNSQLPVYIQLSIFLFRAGHYGNASSPKDTAQWAGVSVGGVEKSMDRVIVTLLSCHDEAVHLPDAAEKENSKSYVGDSVCPEWHGGFLLVDGSKFPFY